MPTIRSISTTYRFYFVSHDCKEKPHVHVEKDSAMAKIWLNSDKSVKIDESNTFGFKKHELHAILNIVHTHFDLIWDTFHEHCKEYTGKPSR